MDIALIGGTFDRDGGRSSGYIEHIRQGIAQTHPVGIYVNGGSLDRLSIAIETLGVFDAALMFADVDNSQGDRSCSMKKTLHSE
jgi:hypothetical protein